jgi:glutathione S-transferase
MMSLYHAPMSRSTRLVQLVDELGALDRVEIRRVDVVRHDGSGGADRRNPHPEGKVPCLVHDGVEIWESVAIAQYLCEMFPEAGLGVPAGDPLRGRYLSWLAWYGDVVEPVVVLDTYGFDTPELRRTFRWLPEIEARLKTALIDQPYLVGDRYTAADLILASTYGWKPELTPDDPVINDWVSRCLRRESVARTWAKDMPKAA